MAKKSNYSKSMPLPGLIHGGENAPLKGKDSPFKHHAYWRNSTEVVAGHSHEKPKPTTQPPKSPESPINMVNQASTTMMNPINQPLVPTPPLPKKEPFIGPVKGEAGLMGQMSGEQPSMIELEKKYNPGKYQGGKAAKVAHFKTRPITKKGYYKKK